jgi:glyoxylase-like metal-dependent hydrolase (beta-lactamase superfamily II)
LTFELPGAVAAASRIGGVQVPVPFYSRERATASVERLRDLAIDTGALIVFGHDPNNWARQRHAPDCYS